MSTADEIMSRKVKTVSSNATIMTALDIMRQNAISCVIVTDSKTPVGVVTERDIIYRAIPKNLDLKKHKVTEIMSAPLITGEPDYDLERISMLMKDHKIRRLPIAKGKKVVGVITETDIVDQTSRLFKQNKRILMQQNIQTILIIVCVVLTMIILNKIFG